MRRVVLDANVVLKWFGTAGEVGKPEALALREEFARGDIDVVVPYLLGIEVLNVAGRRWGWPEADLADLGVALRDLPWRWTVPSFREVARWVGHGLTAYDATYVAVAAANECTVVTSDEQMLAVAPELTTPLVP